MKTLAFITVFLFSINSYATETIKACTKQEQANYVYDAYSKLKSMGKIKMEHPTRKNLEFEGFSAPKNPKVMIAGKMTEEGKLVEGHYYFVQENHLYLVHYVLNKVTKCFELDSTYVK